MIDEKKVLKFLDGLITDDTTKSELDTIAYLKKLVRNEQKEDKKERVDWKPMFEKLWSIYPKKVAKAQATKTFEKKIKGKTEEEVRQFCTILWKKIRRRMVYWEDQATEKAFIPHFSTFINQECE